VRDDQGFAHGPLGHHLGWTLPLARRPPGSSLPKCKTCVALDLDDSPVSRPRSWRRVWQRGRAVQRCTTYAIAAVSVMSTVAASTGRSGMGPAQRPMSSRNINKPVARRVTRLDMPSRT
jgi:hypothetical protein